ncbi:unnamed protein product [Closterium sp. NIES-65]|nr:unnamed protein product [Closterium sp. NIES-65]
MRHTSWTPQYSLRADHLTPLSTPSPALPSPILYLVPLPHSWPPFFAAVFFAVLLLAPQEDKFPLAVFSSGFLLDSAHSGFLLDSAQYRSYAHHLASWGFAVVTYNKVEGLMGPLDDIICARFITELINWAGTRIADNTRVYLCGHSRGAKVSVLAAAMDPRVLSLGLVDPVDNTTVAPLQAGTSAITLLFPAIPLPLPSPLNPPTSFPLPLPSSLSLQSMLHWPPVYAPLAPGYPSAVAAMRAGNDAIEHLLADANPANQGLAVSLPTLVVGGGYLGDCAPAASNYRWFFKEAGSERPSTLSLPTPSSSPLSPPAVYAPLAPGYPSAVAAMRAGNSAIEHLLADANPANQGLAVSLPTLVVGGGYPGDCAPAASNYRWFFKEAGNPSWEVVLRDAGHFQFLDSPPVLQAAVCGLGPARDEDVRRATRACIAAWGHATVPRQRGKTVGGGGRGAVPQQGGGDGGVGGEEEGCISIGGRCGGSGSGGTSGTSDDMDAAAADSWRAGAGREKGPAQAPAQAPAPALTPLTPLTAGENLEAPVSDRKDELEAMMVSVAAELAAVGGTKFNSRLKL